MNYYRQCFIEKSVNDKVTCQTTWIPEQYAHLGNYIKLKQEDGSWEDGWKVTGVGMRLTEEFVLSHERDYKNQRKQSDI